MSEQVRSGGRWRLVSLVLGGLGCLSAVLVVILAAVLIYVLGTRHEPPEPPLAAVDDASVVPAAAPAERTYTMAVCAEPRSIRVIAPADAPLDPSALQVVPGERVGLVLADVAPDPLALARYGWVAADASGGIVRWWHPDDFGSFAEAEPAIREVLGYCEICCASGTVVERDGGRRMIWLQDPRFSLPDGGRVGSSFDRVVRGAPSGSGVEEDEMDGVPTIDLGGVTAYGSLEQDVVVMLVARLGEP